MLNPRPNPRRAPVDGDDNDLPDLPFLGGLAASFEDSRRTRQFGAQDRLLQEQYERQIADIERETGERLFHPLLDTVDQVEANNAERYRQLQQTGRGFSALVIAERQRANVAAFEKELSRLRVAYPQAQSLYGRDELERRINRYVAALRQRAAQAGPVSGFLGGIAGDLTDPVTLATLPVGLSSKTILGAAVREAGVNAVIEATLQPTLQQQEAAFGNQASLTQAGVSVATAGIAGGVFGGGGKALQKSAGFVTREAMIRFGKASDDADLRAAALDLEREADIEMLAIDIDAQAGPLEKGRAAEIVSTIERAMDGQREAIDELAALQTRVDADGNPVIRAEKRSPQATENPSGSGDIDAGGELPLSPAGTQTTRRSELPGSLERALDPELKPRVGEGPKTAAKAKATDGGASAVPERRPGPDYDPEKAFDDIDPRAPEYEAQTRSLAVELDVIPDDAVLRLSDRLDADGNPVSREITKAELAEEIAQGRRALERLRGCIL